MGDFLIAMINGLIKALGNILNFILSILPSSPFEHVHSLIIDNELLQGLAWIIPFPQIISLLSYWLSAIALFYIYQVVLRWIKLIE